MGQTVGLTGGIASGKSSVGRFFRELGVHVVDADEVAREVVEPGTPGFEHVVAAFGPEIVSADGTVDRKRLGAMVFADDVARARINAITHPLIAARSARLLQEGLETGAPYVIYEAALLVENGLHRTVAAVVVAAIDEATQLARIVSRNKLTLEEAKARVAAQLPLADKLAAADYVIWTDGPYEQTKARTQAVHEALLARFEAPP